VECCLGVTLAESWSAGGELSFGTLAPERPEA